MTEETDGRRSVGARGEDIAVAHLEGLGWHVVERNWRCGVGEIDVIAHDPAGVTVFCEVKTRTGVGYGDPLEAITWEKQRRLRQLAATWLHDHPSPRARIDGIGIVLRRGQAPRISHVRGI